MKEKTKKPNNVIAMNLINRKKLEYFDKLPKGAKLDETTGWMYDDNFDWIRVPVDPKTGYEIECMYPDGPPKEYYKFRRKTPREYSKKD